MWMDMAAANTGVQTIVIPTYFHRGRSRLADQVIKDQVAVLNEAYFDAGFSFKLMGILDGNGRRRGDVGTLNVRFDVPRGLLGIATPPWAYRRNPQADGVKIASGSVPGGDIRDFNLGLTLVHEVGHWMGVWHTFQGGCSQAGDEIEDTTPQRRPTSGCPTRKMSACPGVNKEVSFHNFMDYSDDVCMTEFTKMQEFRMQEMFQTYRATSN